MPDCMRVNGTGGTFDWKHKEQTPCGYVILQEQMRRDDEEKGWMADPLSVEQNRQESAHFREEWLDRLQRQEKVAERRMLQQNSRRESMARIKQLRRQKTRWIKRQTAIPPSTSMSGPKGAEGLREHEALRAQERWNGQEGLRVQQGRRAEEGLTRQEGWNGREALRGQEGLRGQQGWRGQEGLRGQQGWRGQEGLRGQQGWRGQERWRSINTPKELCVLDITLVGIKLPELLHFMAELQSLKLLSSLTINTDEIQDKDDLRTICKSALQIPSLIKCDVSCGLCDTMTRDKKFEKLLETFQLSASASDYFNEICSTYYQILELGNFIGPLNFIPLMYFDPSKHMADRTHALHEVEARRNSKGTWTANHFVPLVLPCISAQSQILITSTFQSNSAVKVPEIKSFTSTDKRLWPSCSTATGGEKVKERNQKLREKAFHKARERERQCKVFRRLNQTSENLGKERQRKVFGRLNQTSEDLGKERQRKVLRRLNQTNDEQQWPAAILLETKLRCLKSFNEKMSMLSLTEASCCICNALSRKSSMNTMIMSQIPNVDLLRRNTKMCLNSSFAAPEASSMAVNLELDAPDCVSADGQSQAD
ncbi:unnamed protein product [Didymodactylos carnosus]|uniref:Uncharacterized protein n=1 Tax=Didymodactylos carnosus TaxID=1234261 RepID=A0A814KKK7_9BILA|nr:unnamed protein product [Didymodactylos carnosus]CAF3821913.1 unnamed protein product [Didymodactylos carnosus]